VSRRVRPVKPADLVVLEETGGGDFALVKAASAAGWRWVHSHSTPMVVDDPLDYDLIVEAHELHDAEEQGLAIWRVYSARGRQ
jgi:hypothetical protein